MSDIELDYFGLQEGGGGRATSLSPVLTPTRLRTSIKATNRDRGLISKAQIRRTLLIPPTAKENPGASASNNPFTSSPEIRCAAELFPSAEKTSFLECLKSTSPTGSGMIAVYLPFFFLIVHFLLGSDDTPTPKGKLGTTVGVEAFSSDLTPGRS